MKVALTIWNGRVSPVFDVARHVLLLDVEAGRVVARYEEALPGTDPQSQADRLATLNAQTLICGAISKAMAGLLAGMNMTVIPFTAGCVEEVLAAWLAGNLPDPALSMPGCCRQRRRNRGGRRCLDKASPSKERREEIMKIIVTGSGNKLTDAVDPRFGRASQFLLVDLQTGAMTAHDNAQNLNAAQGAGIQAAETVARLGAGAVITGNVGPKAFRVLSAAGIKVFLVKNGTIAEAIAQFKNDELSETKESNVEGHWA
jgi:predicted Fe-Mo cluster-binding NifX family protein